MNDHTCIFAFIAGAAFGAVFMFLLIALLYKDIGRRQ